MVKIRKILWPDDRSMLLRLDSSFTVKHKYNIVRDGMSFTFQLHDVSRQYQKKYTFAESIDELPKFDWVSVAIEETKIVGVCAIKFESWNRRANVYHLYVDAKFRGQGIGRTLIESAVQEAARNNARCLWVETQTSNSKAIKFYMSMGFALCGFDSSLYDCESMTEIETAVFLSRPIV